ncbi:MAG: hypothetical protein JJ863_18230 [Deltaproteobacteria bacterium]|nr:hypothetical protein [Deltaproteobacteria bacterium]
MIARLLIALWLTTAPFQCASEPDPDRRIADTPSEALWGLAEEFRESGDTEARETTLRRIVERYPDSTEAEMARMALDGREPPPPVEDEDED